MYWGDALFHIARFDRSSVIRDALEAFERDPELRADLGAVRSFEQYLKKHGIVLNYDGRLGGWEDATMTTD